ncbi:alpha/beta fold hydrolase [Octadecabacter sp. SW4]|uniref:alpha/beta fold hydrolase n=1 Tax=Octadecabacter sp. SW4 TaxID=2602067 RepID=UPI0011C1DB3F|nr:alpha/beta fold hydrolase [Octadecabacter sp. SW4]QEE34908.1 alpha/beta fold hydrolase [Octadecabacter sp. SW4]
MLNTLEYGEAGLPKLLIAHGLFGSARNWGVISKRLSDIRHVVSADMRNHGESPRYPTQSYADMAGDLAALLDTPADVLGHSMGGKAAMVMALAHPEKVRKLVVADIAPVAYGHSQSHHIAAMKALDLDAIETRAQAAALLQVDEEVRDFFLQSLDVQDKKWRLNLDVLEQDMAKIIGFPDVSGQFAGPTLFLTGAASDYVQPAHRDRIKALFPKARFAKISGAGHWLHAQQPRAFEQTVRAFLTS